MLSIHDQLADLAIRIARATARASAQRTHVANLLSSGHDAAEAIGLLEMMTRAVEQMLEVQAALEEFSREAAGR